ncbi:fluoride efflux transporter CrcB [Nocardia sp. alder85J]|uniref:fluoride efflux transporter CrcB n=1 Tax=Nocardia sp. alder85J TaxID=2862949 RepID=UPI001CD244AA|nr:fluoride efflux transporter CrcB [Nocardia sp. alder85J]MCX4092916.1 fluoride efflux transporter CrcB [Nocardia sp. alder85J]
MPENRPVDPDVGRPVDPDIDLHIPAQRRELARRHGAVLAVIAAGGGLGALARYGIAHLLPTRPGAFPWGTFVTNVTGCFAIGLLMVYVTETRAVHPLVRPFLGVGILGGFTTFSTYAVETRNLLQPGSAPLAFCYLAGTLLVALPAVLGGVTLGRAVLPIGTGEPDEVDAYQQENAS